MTEKQIYQELDRIAAFNAQRDTERKRLAAFYKEMGWKLPDWI